MDIHLHKESLFLDIETTGLSSTCQIYLIGAGVFKDNMYHIHQWFAESPDDEKNILEALSDFLKSFTSILTFIRERLRQRPGAAT